ncbi:MAG TPA: D-glycero-beta-D-manno-heptose 1,7-bisphosphate 7-phosphatase [Fimbriimonadaceae bacterium]|nr:D-glycero-beta-D-manno-heptose 1,7-bisphosphate 7-phosphatase [Fimbriimonadaceae bacterium]
MQALILAGGLGTRLGARTRETPKPMLEVGGKPFLDYVVWNLARQGVREVVFSIGFRAEQIEEHFRDGDEFGVRCTYIIEAEPAGTGGALLIARDALEPEFLVLNGDSLFDANVLAPWSLLDRFEAVLTLRSVPDAGRYGAVDLDGPRVIGFREKGDLGAGLISGGVYAMRRQALDRLPGVPSSVERDLFPVLAEQGRLGGVESSGFFLDIGIEADFQAGQTALPGWQYKAAVFLDRDGVMNVDHNYVSTPERFEWVEGAPEAIRWLNEQGYLVFVVTNQAGIGRGYYDEAHFLEFTAWISARLAERGAHVDKTYFCPHHPTEGVGAYRRECPCRKPQPGMLLQAFEEWPIDRSRSLMIGDKPKDVQAAEAAGIRGLLFEGGNLHDYVRAEVPVLDRVSEQVS